MTRQFLLSLLLLFSPLIGSAFGQETTTDNDSSSTTATFLESCRSVGFDPWHLSCETCQLLPDDLQLKPSCGECCQSYKSTKRITKPYQSALVVQFESRFQGMAAGAGAHGSDEFDQFLREDLDGLIGRKGSSRLQLAKGKIGQQSMGRSMMMGMYFPVGPTSTLLWFDKKQNFKKDLTASDVDSYTEIAKEAIDLRGWKRDDIRDMIDTLLPDQ